MQSNMRAAIVLSALVFSTFHLCASTRLEATNGAIRFGVDATNPTQNETVSFKENGVWVPALLSTTSATRVVSEGTPDVVHSCTIDGVSTIPGGLILRGDCSVGVFEERVLLTSEPDVLAVEMKFAPKAGVRIRSVEDRYDFAPGRRASNSPASGPVDFVWSQNTKNEADDIVPNWAFKAPVVMLQQGKVFAALMPELSDRRSDPLALDLDVTSDTASLALLWSCSFSAIRPQLFPAFTRCWATSCRRPD